MTASANSSGGGEPCPACGALPCDWTENPFASDDVTADAGGVAGDIQWARDMAELSRQQATTATRPLPELQTITRQQHAWEAERWDRVAAALSTPESPAAGKVVGHG